MTAREVVLDGGSPWGFRMHGGADVGQPLRISRVNPGSKAALKGVREGDVISSINGQSTRNVSNSDAHALLRNAGQTLHLGLNEECSGSPKRRNFRNTAQNDAGRQRVGNCITAANANTFSASSAGNGKVNGNAQGESKLDSEGANAKGRRGRKCRSRRRRGRAAQVRRAASAAVDQVLEEAVTRVASRLEEVVWETAEDILLEPCPPRNVPAVLVEDYDEPDPPPLPPSMPPHEERRLREFLQSLEIVKRADEPGRTAPEPSRRSRRRAVAEHFTRRSRSLDVILEEPSEAERTDDGAKPRTSPRNRNYSLGEETLGEVCTVKESFIAKSHVEELVSFQQSMVTTWQKEEPQECNRVVIAEVEDTDTETGTPGEEGSVEMVASEDEDVQEIDFEPTHSVEIVSASSPPPHQTPVEDNEVVKSEEPDRTADVVLKLLQVLPKQDSSQTSMYTVLSQLTIGQIASLSSGFKKNIEAMIESTTNVASEGEASSDGGDDEATPPQGHSRQGSSSSDATSHNTAVYYPSSTPEPCFQPPSLRVAALKVVLTLPGGSFLLSELDIGYNTPVISPSSSIPPTPPPLPHSFSPASMSPSGSSWISTPPSVPTPPPMMSPPHPPNPCWTGIQSRDDPRLYVCLSPAQTDSYDAAPDADSLLDLHHKFMWRRSYNEQFSPVSRNTKYSQLPPTPPSRRARHGLLHSREWEASSHKAHVMGPPDAAKISTAAAAAGSTGGGEDAGCLQRGAADARVAASRSAMMKLDAAAACGGVWCARNSEKDEEQRLKAQMLSEWLTLARTVPDVVQATSAEDTRRLVYRVNSVDSGTSQTTLVKDELAASERRHSLQEMEQRLPLPHQSRPPLPQSPKRVYQQNSEAQRYLQKIRERHQKHQLEEEERILREKLLMEAPVPSHSRLQEIREQVVAHVKDYSRDERQLTQRLETEANILQNHVETKTDKSGKDDALQNNSDGREKCETEAKSVERYEITKVQRTSDAAEAQKNRGISNEGKTTLRGPPYEFASIEETTKIHQDSRVVRGQTSRVFSLSGGELQKQPSVMAHLKSNQSFNCNAFRRLNSDIKDLDEFSNEQKQFKGYTASNMMEQQITTRTYGRRTSNDSLGEEPQDIVDAEKSRESKESEVQQVRRFEANKYKISKRGDIAVIQEGAGVEPTSWGRRPKSLPPATDGELFRQQMYHEYMAKVAELAERQRQKVIRLSMRPEDLPSATPAEAHLEAEFMGRVRQMGLAKKGDSDDEGGVGAAVELPKHLQELLDAAGSLLLEIDAALRRSARGFLLGKGVWTPKSSATPEPTPQPEHQQQDDRKDNQQQDAPQQPVWTPVASPTAERRFRPVNFTTSLQVEDSTKQTSSSSSSSFIQQSQSQSSETPVLPPWKQPEEVVSRLVQSQSAPASGLSSLTKLPRAQNPTITLLQKAREGQLPKGALYLDHKMTTKEMEKATFGQHEILYTVKKEYEKEMDGQRKKIAELGPRKFEGIGPTTKEGIPIVLRSEIKDTNQAKWYKRMYDSLHRTGKDDDFITIRYRPRRGHYPYTSAGGYLSEPEPGSYDSDVGYTTKYATLDRRRIKNKENDFTTSTVPRSKYVPHPSSIKYATEIYKNQPGRIEDYEPGHSSISDRETKQWWDEVLDIFDGWLDSHSGTPTYRSLLADAMYHKAANEQLQATTPSGKPFMTYALKESGYESDSTLVFKRRDDNLQNQLSPAEQKLAYKTIQKGGEVPLHGLRKPAPERPKEPAPPARSARDPSKPGPRRSESPHRYVESEVTIHYRSPVRSEAKEVLSEEELARRQAEAMRRIYQEERRRKYLQELQDMHSRRHTDNFTPSQKSPIPLNRYDDFLEDNKSKPRDRTPEPKLVARALYNFVGQTSRELTFRRGDIIFVRRQIDKNWYEGEHNAMVGLFPLNYVEIIPYDGIRTIPKRPSEGQAKAKFNFIAQTHLELSLVKGELVVLTRRVDDNWYEGRIGARKGIFPVSYVEVLQQPGDKKGTPGTTSKPATTPTVHSVLVNGSGLKQQPYYSQKITSQSYTSSSPYATLPRQGQTQKQPLAPVNQTLHIDTHQEPVPYRALYNYRPQNEDELELREGDTVYVMEKCDDGWYVGSSQRTGFFGTFPGNYVERLL